MRVLVTGGALKLTQDLADPGFVAIAIERVKAFASASLTMFRAHPRTEAVQLVRQACARREVARPSHDAAPWMDWNFAGGCPFPGVSRIHEYVPDQETRADHPARPVAHLKRRTARSNLPDTRHNGP